MSKYRVMRTWTGSLHNRDAKVETKTELFLSNVSKEFAEATAATNNAAQHKRPKHPDLVKPGESIMHEPDVFSVEEMP